MKLNSSFVVLCLLGGVMSAPEGLSARGRYKQDASSTTTALAPLRVDSHITESSSKVRRYIKKTGASHSRDEETVHNTGALGTSTLAGRGHLGSHSDQANEAPPFDSGSTAGSLDSSSKQQNAPVSSSKKPTSTSKRGLSHSDPDLPQGPDSGVTASLEPAVLSTTTRKAMTTSVEGSPSRTLSSSPVQSHPEQGRPSSQRKTGRSNNEKDAEKRGDGSSNLNMAPTPAPTGLNSASTTVHITSETDFALLLPGLQGESIGDAEADGVAYCSSGSSFPGCTNYMQNGFITAAAMTSSPDNSTWIQITGCLDPSKMSNLDPSDHGGQFDVRFPNGAQCSFGGYGSSFIELVEPAGNRFCIRCCSQANDQINCNSHQDRTGCPNAVPGTYDFPDRGISCSG